MCFRQRYICQSTTCRRRIEWSPGQRHGENSNPSCSCGSEMKKVYSEPVLRQLSRVEARLLLGAIENVLHARN
jgi:hypothetical protein